MIEALLLSIPRPPTGAPGAFSIQIQQLTCQMLAVQLSKTETTHRVQMTFT